MVVVGEVLFDSEHLGSAYQHLAVEVFEVGEADCCLSHTHSQLEDQVFEDTVESLVQVCFVSCQSSAGTAVETKVGPQCALSGSLSSDGVDVATLMVPLVAWASHKRRDDSDDGGYEHGVGVMLDEDED